MTLDFKCEPKIIQLSSHNSFKKGTLFAIEDFDLGISIKRAFYITDFTGEQPLNNRGNHSHSSSSQFIVNIKGEVQIKIVNIFNLKEYNFVLDSPSSCLFLPANHHIFMSHYSKDSVMLVLCDKNFEDDRVNDYFIPEFLDGFRDAAEYLGISLKVIIDKYNHLHNKCSDRMKFKHLSEIEFDALFANKRPSTNKLIEFYSRTDNYILELTEYHSTHARRYMTNEIIRRMKNYSVHEVLDYGCGIGEDSIVLLDNGINTTLCDIAGKTFDFAKWRFNKRSYSPTVAEITEEEQHDVLEDKQFDAIMCFEVLMHVPEPQKTVSFLYYHLKFGGHIFLTYRFVDNYSLALEQNRYLNNSIDDILCGLGLSLIEKVSVWNDKEVYIYKK